MEKVVNISILLGNLRKLVEKETSEMAVSTGNPVENSKQVHGWGWW